MLLIRLSFHFRVSSGALSFADLPHITSGPFIPSILFSYFAQRTDSGLHEALHFVKSQLQLLWSLSMIKTLFEPLFKTSESSSTSSSTSLSTKSVSTDEALGAAAGGGAVAVSSSSSSSKVSSLHQSPPPPSGSGGARDARPKESQSASSSLTSKNLFKKGYFTRVVTLQ